MKKAIVVLLLVSPLFSYKLQHNVGINGRLEVVKNASVEYYENGLLAKKYYERNIVDLIGFEEAKTGTRLRGRFSLFEKDEQDAVYRLREKYESEFVLGYTGRMTVPYTNKMPNVRHIPSFPMYNLDVGSNWTAPAEEILIHLNPPLTLLLSVDYYFVAKEKWGNTNVGIITFNLIIDKDVAQKYGSRYTPSSSTYNTTSTLPENYPERIHGYNNGKIYWDLDKNAPLKMDEKYQIRFFYGDESRMFQMNIDSSYEKFDGVSMADTSRELGKLQNAIASSSKSLNSSGTPNITTTTNSRGLVIRFNDILFDFDSSKLTKDALENLDKIAGILKSEYPSREIIVEGHTDNIGDKSYNYSLSEERAESVAEFLQKHIGHGKISFRGLGDSEPLKSNSTEDGRRQNRRVDIIIKLK